MADVTVSFDASFAPMFESEARGMAAHPWVMRVLADRGVNSVDDLTPQQQAKLVLKAWAMFKQQQHKRREAEIVQGEFAAQTVEDTFPTDVD